MKYTLLFITFFLPIIVFSQSDVTPQVESKLKKDIEKKVPAFKAQLIENKESETEIEFDVDTFKIEQLMAREIELDNSTLGMRNSGDECANLYDSLMNKYYKKLSAVLKGDDKKTLVQAQRAWLIFRDAETKLNLTLSKDEYSGGGTIQELIINSEYLELIKHRTLALFEDYFATTQN